MSKNRNLNRAKVAKNDEFYTRLSDIEKEMVHYKKHFKGKTIYCPCDDPYASNFFKYFAMNFEHLGLKRLITACYKNTDPLRRSNHDMDGAIWLEYTGDKNGNRIPDPSEIGVHRFEGDGDFRSEESRELMRQSDIVITNPPFSLFREFVDVLMEEEKKFLTIGSLMAVMYRNLFPYIKDGLAWLGCTKAPEFEQPDGGTKRFGNVGWYTNLDHRRRNEEIVCYKRYNPKDYPKYDNYKAIEVSRVNYIPADYDGVMGVPITFVEKHNPKQFKIVDIPRKGCPLATKRSRNLRAGWAGLDLQSKLAGPRILIRHAR